MSRPNILQKVADGEDLTDEELQWAKDHSIPGVEGATVEVRDDLSVNPPTPLVTTGPMGMPAAEEEGTEVVDEDYLDSMTKKQLQEFAAQNGIEVSSSMKHGEMVQAILDGLPAEEEPE